MKITVRVVTRSKYNRVEKVNEERYIVRVSVPPEDGKANQKVITLLAAYFDIAPSQCCIIRGLHHREKVIELAI